MSEGMNEHANLKNETFDKIMDRRIIDTLCDRVMSVLHKQDLPLGASTAHLEAAMFRLLGSFAVARMCNAVGKAPDLKIFGILSDTFRDSLETRYSPLVESFEDFVKLFLSDPRTVKPSEAPQPPDLPVN